MSTLFFRNRRLLVLAIAVILVAGLSSYMVLPRAEDPTLVKRAARVLTFFPGAGAERVETLVTEPLEEKLQEIEEIRDIISLSRDGVSVVSIELHDAVPAGEVDNVWSRIRDKVDDAGAVFPTGAGKSDFDELEITAFTLMAAVTWERDDAPAYNILRRVADDLEDRLRAVAGTAEVENFGAVAEEVRVEIDAARLAALDLTASDVARAIARSDSKVPAGHVRQTANDLLVEIEGEVDSLARVEQVPVRVGTGGQTVHLGHIARVAKTVIDPPAELALIGGKPAITVSARMETAQRIDQWAADARAVVEAFRADLPAGLGLNVVFDQSKYVEARLHGLEVNLLLGMMLVVVVIFFMMGWRSAILVGSALPLASLMVLTGMRLLEVPIQQMSVTGLIIALGLLIDNAIVIVDETRRRLREGHTPRSAVDQSVRHLAIPLASSTFTTMLSFLPLVLMPGGAGEFVGSIGLSVILAIVSSFLLAMTVIPALTALLDGRAGSKGSGIVSQGFNSVRLEGWYRRTLGKIYARPVLGVLIAAILPVIGFSQFSKLQEQFFPPADRDQFQVELRLPPQTALAETLRIAESARARLLHHPRVQEVHWMAGTSIPKFYYNMMGGEDGAAYYAQALVQLDSSRDAEQVVREVQEIFDAHHPEAQAVARMLEQGPPFEAPIAVRVYGPDLDVLRRIGDDLRVRLARIANVQHTRTTLRDGTPKLWVKLDEEEARLAGLDNLAVAEQLRAHLDGAVGGTLLEETEELPVRVRLASAERSSLDRIATLDLRSNQTGASDGGRSVPLAALGELHLAPELASVPRRNQTRVNTVQGFVRAGVLPATVLTAFNEALAEEDYALPAGYRLELGGEQAERDRAIGNLLASVSVLVVIMVATLVLSFGSFRMAGILGLVAAQSAGLGIAALAIFGYPFGFMAIVGTMGLIGVAINDSIVVLAAIREDEQARTGDPLAVRDVVVRASRHVFSTTLTTVAGFIPLLVAGGDFWPPLAVAIAGGVFGATLLALYFAPSAYILLMCPRCRAEEAAVAAGVELEDELPAGGLVAPAV
jgi:multidrug efflux pump